MSRTVKVELTIDGEDQVQRAYQELQKPLLSAGDIVVHVKRGEKTFVVTSDDVEKALTKEWKFLKDSHHVVVTDGCGTWMFGSNMLTKVGTLPK